MESQPQNPEFRNNPENLHTLVDHYKYLYKKDLLTVITDQPLGYTN